MHYNYRSGFLENVNSILKLGKRIYPLYKLEKDLVLMGLLFHNIGAIKAINSDYQFDFTTVGKLLENEVLSKELINRHANQIDGFPSSLLIKLNHIVLSSFKLIKESKMGPSFPEALLVNAIVDLDIKMFMMKSAINLDRGEGDFTSRYNIFRYSLLKKEL